MKNGRVRVSYIKFLTFFILLIFIMNSGISEAREKKDLILILDTSLSMVGYGGRNILHHVKNSLSKFIDQLEDDDSITLITFDTRVKIYPTIYIADDNDKDILKKYISVIDALGKWTYTSRMLKDALQKAKELEDEEKDRQRVLVVMTDAIDDPPPDRRRDRLNIRDVAKNYKGKDWFIFFVNLGDLKRNKRLVKVQKELKETVSEYTKIIDIDRKKAPKKKLKKKIEEVIEEDLQKNIEEMVIKKRGRSWAFSYLFIPLLIILALIAVIFIILFYIKKMSGARVYGKLEYWDHTLLKPEIGLFDLTRLNLKEISIGKRGSLRISEIEISEPFRMVAIREKGVIKNAIYAGKGYSIDFVNRDPGAFLENGDIFKVENYTFKYIDTDIQAD